MFENFKPGDIIYSKTFGRGKVEFVRPHDNFPIIWLSDKGVKCTFMFNGKNGWLSEESDLYYGEKE